MENGRANGKCKEILAMWKKREIITNRKAVLMGKETRNPNVMFAEVGNSSRRNAAISIDETAGSSGEKGLILTIAKF